MSLNTKLRKRLSFTPIMLTSKSIRPVDRSDYELTRNQIKFSGVKKTRDDLTSYIFRDSAEFSSTAYCFENGQQYDPNEGNNCGEEAQEQNYKQLIRKMTTPAVIKVQFQKEIKNRKRADSKAKQSPQNDEGKTENNRFVYFTNARTFEQFTKMAKIRPNKKNSYIMRDQVDGQWKKYLDKYYLNIRKVKPLLREGGYSILSPTKINRLPQKVEKPIEDIPQPPQLMPKFKSNTHFVTHSKRQNRQSRLQMITQREQSQEPIEHVISNTVYKKIEQDVSNHRSCMHKKEFFVFGLSETAGKSAQAVLKNKFDSYRDFIFRVNFTNSLYVKARQESDKPLKFFVGFGNNSAIIKGIMKRRFWWQIVDKVSQDTNFVWTQLKITECFNKQSKSLCKFRIHKYNNSSDLSKQVSIKGIEKSTQNVEINRNIMYGEDLRLWDRYIQKNNKYQQKGFQVALGKRVGGLLKKKGIRFIEKSIKLKVHNHFQSNYFLGNKKALFYCLRKYYTLINQDPFTKIPLTFHITQGLQDPQFQNFLTQFSNQNQKRKVCKQFRNIWIIKPGELTNRGRGITVCSTLDQIKNRLKSKQRNGNGTSRTFIVQKYIEKPLLYQKRKFDIRHYMAISCHNGKMKGYWYAEGYIRTTSSQYNIKNTKDLFTHLTNDAVQKYGQDYGKYQKGNKLSYADFQKYLVNNVAPDIDFFGQILPKMKNLATDSMKATYNILDQERREHNFELFGLDFMLDEYMNVFLIEVNTNPCLQTSCPLLTKIITPLIQNVFKLCLDPLFPPPYQWPPQKKYNLGENALQENKFTLVFDESQEGHSLKQLYKNTSKIDEKMGDIYEQDQQYQDQQKEWNDDDQKQAKKP